MTDNLSRSPEHELLFQESMATRRRWRIFLGVLVVGFVLAGLLLPAIQTAERRDYRHRCINNLKNIGLALHSYHDIYHAFPPAYTVDAAGKPLHSWRTLILPFLEEEELYKSIDLTKPWDDPVNAKAFQTRVPYYCCPNNSLPDNHTTYLALVGENLCLLPTQPRSMKEITDGTSKTLLVVEAPPSHSIPWMSPQDADQSLVMDLLPDGKQAHRENFTNVLFGDGHVISDVTKWPFLKKIAAMTIAGGEKFEED